MLRAKRDNLGGPPGHAVPSLGEIEGRVFVLQIMATVALASLLKRSDADGRAQFIAALRHAIDRKCEKANLAEADIVVASKYAQGLLDEALERAAGSSSER